MDEQLALVPLATDRGDIPSQAQYFLGYSGWWRENIGTDNLTICQAQTQGHTYKKSYARLPIFNKCSFIQ